MLARPQLAAEHEPVIAGHHDVEHDEVDPVGLEKRPHLPPVRDDSGAQAVLLQIIGNELSDFTVVIDDQDVVYMLHVHAPQFVPSHC